MTIADAIDFDLKFAPKVKQPLGKWLTAKNGKPYMNLIRLAPNRKSHGGSAGAKCAIVIQVFVNPSDITFTVSSILRGLPTVTHKYVFSAFTKKTGEKVFHFKRIVPPIPGGVRRAMQIRHASPYRLSSDITGFYQALATGKRKEGSKAAIARISSVVNPFILKHHPEAKKFLKYSPKDPFARMLLCLYPSYEMFAPSTFSKLPLMREAKKNLVKGLLKTNGNRTRKLLIDVVNDWGIDGQDGIKLVFLALKETRKRYGLDNAIKLIKISSPECIINRGNLQQGNNGYLLNVRQGWNFGIMFANLKDTLYCDLNIFNHYSFDNFVKLFSASPANFNLLNDTCRMIRRLGGIPMGVEHKSIQELHDALVRQIPANTRAQKEKEENRFACSLESGKLVKAIEQLVPSWEVIFPSSNKEITEWSNTMHHCIAAYAYSISRRQCDCVAILDRETQKMIYNLEINLGQSRQSFMGSLPDVSTAAVVQAKGKYNANLSDEHREIIEEACRMVRFDCHAFSGHFYRMNLI
jgi:hypothetical protein